MRVSKGRHRSLIVVGIVAGVLFGLPAAVIALVVLLAVIATVLGLLVAVASVAGPWLAVGGAGYCIWRYSSRNAARRRAGAGDPAWRPTQPAAPPYPVNPHPVGPAPDPAAWLPEPQRGQVHRIRRKADTLLGQQDRFAVGSRDLYLVRQTRGQYLPAAVDAYLRLLPAGTDRPVAPDGRTSLQVLQSQLHLMEDKLDRIADDLRERNVGRLLANERLLEEQVGRRQDSELTIPGP